MPTRSFNEALPLIAKSFFNRTSHSSLFLPASRIRRPTSRCNFGQKIVEKFTKSSKIVFSMEYFTVDFSKFSSTNVKICLVNGWLKTRNNIRLTYKAVVWYSSYKQGNLKHFYSRATSLAGTAMQII